MDARAQERGLVKALRRLARASDLQSRRIEREAGLTLPQLVVLGCARDLGESATTRAIAAEADISDATVVAVLEKLEAKGLVARRRSAVDRRIVHTALTPRGAAVLTQAPPILGAAFARAFAALPEAERAALVAAFERVADLAGAQARDGADRAVADQPSAQSTAR